ncbi:MAG: DUF4332 domain-containing protein [Pirellulales bacterium]
MSLLFRVLFAAATKNTHHRLALDAVNLLRHEQGPRMRDLLLYHYEAYLKGSKAPDEEFKDFQNHVLHVQDNYWGGAIKTAQLWYKLTVDALKLGDWKEAAYSAGVMSHYLSDPFMPFHTGQTEAEGKVHRACEWSISQSYVELRNILEQDLGGFPNLETPTTSTWLADLIRYGAEEANKHYFTCIDHYNLAQGVKNPPLGLDQELKDRIAGQIGLAAVAIARAIDKALADAAVDVPQMNLTTETLISTSLVPIFWITKKLTDVKDRAAVMAIYDEVQRTGKAVATLPEDEKVVRKLHAEQVLKTPLRQLDAEKPKPSGTQHGQGAAPRKRSNTAHIITPPNLWHVPALPKLSSIHVPSLGQVKQALHTAEIAGKLKSIKVPKVIVPKLSTAQLKAAKQRLAQVKFPRVPLSKLWKRKAGATPEAGAKSADAELRTSANTAEVSPLKTVRKPVTSDLDVPVRKSATSALRADGAEPTPPPPAGESRRDAAGGKLKFYLNLDSPVADAPSIGPKTARRFESVGIRTVRQLVDCDPTAMAPRMKASFIDAEVLERWQQQATLVCRIPRLRGHDAQILVGCGINEPEALARRQATQLLDDVEDFLSTPEGEKALRGGERPDLAEVDGWIAAAKQARALSAAVS